VADDRTIVDVWAGRLDGAWDGAGVCTRGELDRAAAFGHRSAGARWLAARHVLRTVLAERLGCRPDALVFETGPHGKPSVPGIEFNLSHAGSIAVVAVAARPVGIDVEVRRRIANPAGIAHRLGLEWGGLSGADQTAALLRAWTRTEALVKATGDGASAGLAGVEERLAPEGWMVVDLDLGTSAVGAVAARGSDWVVAGPRWVQR
jgi:4'-phosphopantetheinyl transferase